MGTWNDFLHSPLTNARMQPLSAPTQANPFSEKAMAVKLLACTLPSLPRDFCTTVKRRALTRNYLEEKGSHAVP